MSDHEHALLTLLRKNPSLGNAKARELLGWDQATYDQVKQALVAKGQVAIKLEGPRTNKPEAGICCNEPVTQDLQAESFVGIIVSARRRPPVFSHASSARPILIIRRPETSARPNC
jgi:hypothetical protein